MFPSFLKRGPKSEAKMTADGELLSCDCEGHRQQFVVLEKPQAIAGNHSESPRVYVARARDEHTQLTRLGAETAREFQVLLIAQAPAFLHQWIELFLESRSPLLWTVYAKGVVVDGPWDHWDVVIGEPWSRTLKAKERLSADDLNRVYLDISQALFLLHQQGEVHGGLGMESVIEAGSPPNWKLLPPLQRLSRIAEDDIHDFASLIHRQLVGTAAPENPAADGALSHVSRSWQMIFQGCLNTTLEQRWSAGRAIFGSQPLPIPGLIVVEAQGDNRVISWETPRLHGGELVETALYEVGRDLDIPMGSVRELDALEHVGNAVSGFDNPVTIHRPVNGRKFQVISRVTGLYCPIIVFGPVVLLSDLPEVVLQDVRIRDGQLHALWEWPGTATAVFICVRNDRFPQFPEEALRKWRVGQGQHRRSAWNSWPMDGQRFERLYVTAFAVDEVRAAPRSSSGAAASCRWNGLGYRYRVDYSLVQALTKQNIVRISLESRASVPVNLPPLVLGVSRNHAPRKLIEADYDVPVRQPITLSPGRRHQIEIPCDRFVGQKFLRGRLFGYKIAPPTPGGVNFMQA